MIDSFHRVLSLFFERNPRVLPQINNVFDKPVECRFNAEEGVSSMPSHRSGSAKHPVMILDILGLSLH